MPLRPRGWPAAAIAALAAAAVAAPASGIGPATGRAALETVTVGDDYYAPVDLSVKRGTKVKWRWDSGNTNTHDVVLTDVHPKGVKRKDFHSASGSIGVKFARQLEEPGKYEFVCTFHRTVMRMTIEVKKG